MHAMGIHAKNRKAVVFCEGALGQREGVITNCLVVTSRYFDICAVIDSNYKGLTTASVVNNAREIPIYGTLAEVLQKEDDIGWLVYGKLPSDHQLSSYDRSVVHEALSLSLSVVSGLLQFLADESEFVNYAQQGLIHDLCCPPPISKQRMFTGDVEKVPAKRILIAGTDCDQGQHTTAHMLYLALKESGVSCAMVATSRTGILQGVSYGLCLSAWSLVGAEGGIEELIIRCWNDQRPDVILIEAPTSASHPGLLGGIAVLRGCRPHMVIMQDTPGRTSRVNYPGFAKPDIRYEIALIKRLVNVAPIAIVLNNESLSETEMAAVREELMVEYQIPVTNPLQDGVTELVECVRQSL